MKDEMQTIKADYKKYLLLIRDVYECGEKGFPPEQNSERLLDFNEYVEWWKEKKLRVSKLAEEYTKTRSRVEMAEIAERLSGRSKQ